MAIYMWRDVSYRTFTISWEEKSNMSSGWTYSDDAAGLTAGDSAFDEFFGYSGVRLSTAGVETATISQADSGGNGKLDITQLGTLTGGDNVMIKFPRLGIKMTKSGSVITLSITDEPNKTGYQYYAHTKGTTIKDALYMGAYKMTSNYTSLSGDTPLSNLTRAAFRSGVQNKYGNGYSQITWYPRNFINALYIMKYGNPNSQATVGMGYVGGSSMHSTGGTNSQTNATYGTSGTTTQVKLFGLEDRWGNAFERLDGCWLDSTTQLTVDKTNNIFQDSDYSTNLGTTSSGYMSAISGTNDGMFQNKSSSAGTDSTYYTDISTASTSKVICCGGYYNSNKAAGAFMLNGGNNINSSGAYFCSRLMYL